MQCDSSAINGLKTVESANYETLVDYEFHSDDQYIRCHKPIVLKYQDKQAMPVPFVYISEEMEKISANLGQHEALKSRSLVVYAFSESNQVSSKIASLMKNALHRKNITTLEDEPDPLLLSLKSESLIQVSADCKSGLFASHSELARIFAIKPLASNTLIEVGLCYQKTWEVLL